MLEQDRWPHATVAAGIVADADHHVEADPRLRWLMPGGPSGDAVRTVLDELVPHDDATVVWIAGEAGFVKAVRRDLDERATPPRHVRAAGYWRRSRTSTEVDDQILERTNELIATGEDLAVLDEFALAVPD